VIFPGTVQDADFNAVGYFGMLEVKKQFGVEVAFSENVSVADAERVAREYISAGYGILAFHGGQFVTVSRKLAPQFKEVVFIMQSTGPIPDLPPNVWNIGRKWYRGFYPLGVLAALTTRANKVGFIAGIRLPDFTAQINSVQQALKEHNPKATLVYTFTGDQNDPVKARQTATCQNLIGDNEGMALVASPEPVIASSTEEGILFAELDLDRLRELRGLRPKMSGTHEFATIPGVLGFRRPEVFHKNLPE
jgi:basic membrane protein A